MARPALSACLELLKPVTWFAPIWAYSCGIVSSGQGGAGRWHVIAAGLLIAGPLVCGTSQAINDWYDRHVDAINEPHRPIPSGRIPGDWGFWIAVVWTALSLMVATVLGPWGFGATVVGLALAWAYSAPPLRLKRDGWLGGTACAACYEGLPWITGAAVMAGGAPGLEVLVMAGLYSLGAIGIMTLNDFKAVEGDRRTGINSLPVRLGEERAAQLACALMAAPQVAVVWLLLAWGAPWHAGAIAVSLLAQVALMRVLLADPKAKAPWYNGTGTTLYVLGMLVTAFALRPAVLP
ncbi:chlorophyll synthase ChlG [Paracraurococcus ruber]|uniref:Bacteriochlorophyll/chlorophyll a synthase n=1 Tax=Paracraurococcus ruber TaxID=77675 RepID=A0ABS1CW02_9PROT|nr:bacteriochlorophyll/chlorophyll a synthase [Paracraurococcus ruber]TDG32465.1 chlorophyll synthase ChlG [Paracraurococcus ruber]